MELSGIDHIPDTYRDDLLREIALMKSVGQHANIVSMVGACTARRPIALIMEYVPYGNLQNFLKFVSSCYFFVISIVWHCIAYIVLMCR